MLTLVDRHFLWNKLILKPEKNVLRNKNLKPLIFYKCNKKMWQSKDYITGCNNTQVHDLYHGIRLHYYYYYFFIIIIIFFFFKFKTLDEIL